MAKSDTILGRIKNQQAFEKRLKHNSKLTRMRWGFRVSAYLTDKGKLRFTDAIDDYNIYTAKPSVRYRIKIYPKQIEFSN